MGDGWTHVGRLWTNGEQFLAIDSAGRSDWRGHSDDEFAVFTAAADGDGEFASPLRPAQPGPVPAEHGPPTRDPDPGLLIRTDGVVAYRLKVRWYTRLDDDSCFARWLLVPEEGQNDRW
ncbi:hypothetical protein [Actinoplanes subglobosus]|uniref:Uncharacterized protein n=1 Tax=Actinoplanes subglobosus TaxID=1547892 RepID=A0ABV8IVX8_9ACTN